MPASLRVAGQRLAAVSVLTDPDDADGTGECLLRVLGLFDEAGECDAWVRNVAGARVQHEHVDVVAACAWICPWVMRRGEDAPKEVYRNEELDQIIQHHRQEPDRVLEYKDWMKREGSAGGAASDSVTLVDEEGRRTAA